MHHLPTILGALALAASSAHAGTFLGHVVNPGTARAAAAVAQASSAAHLRTAFLQVTYTDGSVTYPEFTMSGTSLVVTTTGAGGCRTDIQMRMTSATKTLVTVNQYGTTSTPGVKSISFGTPNSRVVYDIKSAAVYTPGSDLGFVPSASTLTGDWTAQLEFIHAIALTGTLPQGDLYNTMRVQFTSPMYAGSFAFTVDTDALP